MYFVGKSQKDTDQNKERERKTDVGNEWYI
jgi:hypothetical protein